MVTRGIPQRLLPLLGALRAGRAGSVKPVGLGTRRPDHLGTTHRALCSSPRLQDSSAPPSAPEEKVTVHFINRDGERLTAKAKEGDSLLDVVLKQNLDIEGFGACEGTLACSTCHLLFSQDVYDQLDFVTDEEMDMLDLAYGLTNTSRLGCQVCLTKAMDGLTVRVPTEVSDVRRDEVEQKSKQ